MAHLMTIDIYKYPSNFQGGTLFEVVDEKNSYALVMESRKLPDIENGKSNLLTQEGTLRGVLHLEDVGQIFENRSQLKVFSMQAPEGNIIDFKIDGNNVFFSIVWQSKTPEMNYYSKMVDYKLEAKKIWWENFPHVSVGEGHMLGDFKPIQFKEVDLNKSEITRYDYTDNLSTLLVDIRTQNKGLITLIFQDVLGIEIYGKEEIQLLREVAIPTPFSRRVYLAQYKDLFQSRAIKHYEFVNNSNTPFFRVMALSCTCKLERTKS